MRYNRPFVFAALLLFAFAAVSQNLPQGVQRVTSVEGITEYRFANGLDLLLFPDNSKPTVTVNVTYLVGSRHEGYGEAGMAHLLEHMLFKGTTKRPEVVPEIRNHASGFNGSTSYDRTNYFENVPTSMPLYVTRINAPSSVFSVRRTSSR